MLQFLFVVLTFNLFANDQFYELRHDTTVPSHCQEMDFGFYPQPTDYFVVGRKNAREAGFTFEYPVTRDNARTLWTYFKGLVRGEPNEELFQEIWADPEMRRDYVIINGSYQALGFDFGNEGEVLEILAIHDLYREFPSNHYFISGSVEYKHGPDTNTMGEVDIFVGVKETCEAVAVGEVKLGWTSALKKAKKQLKRFSGFLEDYNAGPLANEYQPGSSSSNNPSAPAAKSSSLPKAG